MFSADDIYFNFLASSTIAQIGTTPIAVRNSQPITGVDASQSPSAEAEKIARTPAKITR